MNPRENNKLIAEFMGIPNRTEYGIFTGEAYTEVKGNDDEWIVARYHNSWDWIMPVVDKIGELYSVAFPTNEKFIEAIMNHEQPIDKEYMDVIALPLSTPIAEVYEAVVTFIKWHNSQKP